jgi:hypothetical protein
MKKLISTGMAGICALSLASTASAPGFVEVTPKMQDYNLVVDFTSNGHTPDEMVRFALIGKARATYGCIAKGTADGQTATDLKIVEKVAQYREGTFQVREEGWVREVISLGAPEITEAQSCSNPDHRIVLAKIEFSNVRLLNLTNGDKHKFPHKFSKAFFGTR